MKNEEVASDKNPGAKSANEILQQIYLPFAQSLKTKMLVFFREVEEGLSHDMTNDESSHYEKCKECAKSIHVHKFNVLISFLNSIKNAFSLFGKGNYHYFEEKIIKVISQGKNADSVIDKDDFEEKQRQNAFIHKFEKRYIKELFISKQQLTQLKGETVDFQKLPFGLFVIVSSFAKSIRLLHFDNETKQTLYTYFEIHVLESLTDVYSTISLAIHPKSKDSFVIKESVVKTIETVEPELNIYSQNDINKALKIVQNNLSLTSPFDVKDTLIKQLSRHSQPNKLKLSRFDKNSIDMITLMFQFVQNDRHIPKEIRVILEKLQVPFLKAAIEDKEFLKNSSHPAKELLNLLVQASYGWDGEKDEDCLFLNQYIKIQQDLINEEMLNQSIFKAILVVFNDFIKSDDNLFKEEQKQANNVSRGRSKIKASMKTVDALLAHKMENQKTPSFIQKLLLGQWKNVLVLLLVRHTNSSYKYLSMIDFIDDLFEALTSLNSNVGLQKSIEKLTQNYCKGLKLIAYDDSEISVKSKEFKVFLFDFIETHELKENEQSDFPNLPSDNTRTRSYSGDSVERGLKGNSNKPSHSKNMDIYNGLKPLDKQLIYPIKVGTWLEFIHTNGNKIRAQLSWVNPKTKKFLFVNENGLKITDKTAQQLADDLREKRIEVVKKYT